MCALTLASLEYGEECKARTEGPLCVEGAGSISNCPAKVCLNSSMTDLYRCLFLVKMTKTEKKHLAKIEKAESSTQDI